MDKKPILLLCGCRKYEEYLHAAIRRMQRAEYEIIAIVGSPDEKPSFNEGTRILTLPVPDTYEALPSKIHAAFSWIAKERPGIPGVFKTDDDMVFDMDALVATIRDHCARPYWGVAAGVCKESCIDAGRIQARFVDKTLSPSHQSASYCFGWGYWISAAALPFIVDAGADYASSYLEDVCTGFVLNRAKIMPVRIRFPYKEMPRDPQLLALL